MHFLLGVQLDDEVFFDGKIGYVFDLGESGYGTGHVFLIEGQPLGHGLAVVCFQNTLDLGGIQALGTESDHVANLNQVRRNINLLTVHGEVTVNNQLTSLGTGHCKSQTGYNVVQTGFADLDQVAPEQFLVLSKTVEYAVEVIAGAQKRDVVTSGASQILKMPEYRDIDKAHELGMHFWLHTCGNVEVLLPKFIELGIDVIHPIQKYAMDEKNAAEKYGDKIAIWAGFDVQRTIPYGTPEDVRKEVRFMVDTYLRKDGRFMFTLGNNATGDTPIESLKALLDEIFTYGNAAVSRLKED